MSFCKVFMANLSSLVMFHSGVLAFSSAYLTFHLNSSAWAFRIISKYATRLRVLATLTPLFSIDSSEALNCWLITLTTALTEPCGPCCCFSSVLIWPFEILYCMSQVMLNSVFVRFESQRQMWASLQQQQQQWNIWRAVAATSKTKQVAVTALISLQVRFRVPIKLTDGIMVKVLKIRSGRYPWWYEKNLHRLDKRFNPEFPVDRYKPEEGPGHNGRNVVNTKTKMETIAKI